MPIFGIPKEPVMLCLSCAHPLSSRRATITLSYRSLTRLSLPLSATQHGKEEEILFRDLGRKKLVEEHRQIMNEFIEDHKWGRVKVSQLLQAKGEFVGGKQEALAKVLSCLNEIAGFYPKHIEKKDKHFFLPCMDYFTETERDRMLEEEMDFDKGFIHKIYKEKTQ